MYLYDYYYVSVLHYGAGFFPDNIILLTRCYYNWETQINRMKSLCHYSIKMFPCRQRFDPPPLSDWVDVQKVYSLQSTAFRFYSRNIKMWVRATNTYTHTRGPCK